MLSVHAEHQRRRYCWRRSEKFHLLRARREEREGGRVRERVEEGEGGIWVRGERGGTSERGSGRDGRRESGRDSSGRGAETLLGKQKHETDYAFFPAPIRRKILSEVPASTVGFMGKYFISSSLCWHSVTHFVYPICGWGQDCKTSFKTFKCANICSTSSVCTA